MRDQLWIFRQEHTQWGEIDGSKVSTRLQFTWEAAEIVQAQLYKHAGSRADGSDPPTEVFSPPTPAAKYCLTSSPTREYHDRLYLCARGS